MVHLVCSAGPEHGMVEELLFFDDGSVGVDVKGLV